MTRRHGWQRPLHPLQIVGVVIYSVLVVAFYTFLGLFLGNRVAVITVISVFSFVAFSVIVLFIRCTAIDPSDKTSSRKRKRAKSKGVLKLSFKVVLSQVVVRFFRRIERKILRNFIRRTYLDPWKSTVQLEPLLPFPLVMTDDAVTPDPREEDDISYCSLCDLEVRRSSKHCRTCNRCVEGFDHHCRWLNNCVGKRNYSTFMLLMVFVLLMLIIEGGTAIAIFIRCFVDKKEMDIELRRRLYVEFPRWAVATISVLLVLLTVYGSAAMGQLFFFHVVLIRKGMRTYDYILAMREENQLTEIDPFDDLDSSSDESSDFGSPERSRPKLISRFICGRTNEDPQRLSIQIDGDEHSPSTLISKKPSFHVSINPWKLITLSSEKALQAAEKARERLRKTKPVSESEGSLKPLPLETKFGPLPNSDSNVPSSSTPASVVKLQVSPGRFSSPRRRFSGSSGMFSGVVPSPKQKYRSNFDLKLTEVSRELESYISRQVLCSVIKQDGSEASPR
ncbi:PREDICTED: protein S-acyltransferase 18 [Tarenaya hassleriana]|uniref:protein S-acyltransferase 18 n=1 Tax=Tarenaya hassleriana TaxID=28532 RepID=UPI00053C5700|nr:PREDICTED: protein S-acyltransferase 18 [Tarenaya hassleriana]